MVGGTVTVNPSGKASGRGAYLCREENDDSIGKVRGRLGHALRINIEDSDWEGVVLNVNPSFRVRINREAVITQ